MFCHVDINFDDMFELRMSRGDIYKLFEKRNTSCIRLSFYTSAVVTFNTLSAFERTIKLIDFTDYLKCFLNYVKFVF